MFSFSIILLAGMLVLAASLGFWLGQQTSKGEREAARCLFDAATDARNLKTEVNSLASALASLTQMPTAVASLTDTVERMDHNQTAIVQNLVRIGLIPASKVDVPSNSTEPPRSESSGARTPAKGTAALT